jgi:hypothetical protein
VRTSAWNPLKLAKYKNCLEEHRQKGLLAAVWALLLCLFVTQVGRSHGLRQPAQIFVAHKKRGKKGETKRHRFPFRPAIHSVTAR